MDDMRELLRAAGLRQKDLCRLVELLSGGALPTVTVNRWCSGSRATPPIAVAMIELWRRLPEADRQALLAQIRPKRV